MSSEQKWVFVVQRCEENAEHRVTVFGFMKSPGRPAFIYPVTIAVPPVGQGGDAILATDEALLTGEHDEVWWDDKPCSLVLRRSGPLPTGTVIEGRTFP